MGTGIATVAGLENEPLSHCADIEQAQAELRQELADRNERQRELEFLEKGGDPLEFNFRETATGLWTLPPANPFVKHLLPSDERGSLSALSQPREDNAESDLEDGSERKRARSLSGKFLYLGHSATPISVENLSIIPSNEDDRKDASKKEIDAFKNNKVIVKGQYARRNRQRSNRFGNGTATLRDPVKAATDGGSLSSSIVPGSLINDAEGIQGGVQTVTSGDVPLQGSYPIFEGDDTAANHSKTATEVLALANHNLPETSSADLRNVDLALQTMTPETDVKVLQQQNEVQESMERLPSSPLSAVEGLRDLPPSPPHSEVAPKVCSPSGSVGNAQANHSVRELSTCEVGPCSDSKETNKDPSLEPMNVLDNRCRVDKEDRSHTPRPDGGKSSIEHGDMMKTLPLSECRVVVKSTSSMEVNLEMPSTSKCHDSEEKENTSKCGLMESRDTVNKLSAKSQEPEEVEVKVEEEMCMSDARPVSLSSLQDGTAVPGISTSSCVVPEGVGASVPDANGLPDKEVAVSSLPSEKTDKDGTDDGKTESSVAAKKVDKQESEGVKVGEPQQESLKQSADQSKRTDFWEPPRKRSHWDYVLEEMAWMANDFIQERLWKTAAASQVARWIAKSKQQLEFEEMELRSRQCKVAQSMAREVKKFWHMVEALLLNEAQKVAAEGTAMTESTVIESKSRPVHAYAMRFLKDIPQQHVPQAEAPPTPDRVSESGLFDFWEEQFPEESLFYIVPDNAMEVYRQSVVSQWEREYEQRLQEHEAALAEADGSVAAEATEYSSGAYVTGALVSPLVTGKRSSAYMGGNQTHTGSIPTKRIRTSAVAARQRAAGGTGPLVSIPVAHITRSDISSCETNSQQDEMTTLLEGSSISGRATDADSNAALARNNFAADGVDSPFKSKKKKKARHVNSVVGQRDIEHLWQHTSHRRSEQKDHSKQKGEQGSGILEGLGAFHGATGGASSASKLMKQIASRDRGRKYKGPKGSLNQPGFGLPWSPAEDQAIVGLVYELGTNWELVSDILSSNSQLKGIFRKPKDCKERYKMLTDRSGGDGGDSPDDLSSSAHFPISMTQKGGTRFLPQHLEETLRSHIECILQLHQQVHSKKQQMESHEPKQLVAEHESHAIKHTTMTPLELCELSSTSGELAPHSYPLQPSHGNGLGIPSMLSSGMGMRPTSSSMPTLPGSSSLQLSPSMSPSAVINAAATRDAQRMGVSLRSLTTEEQRLRYNRMVAGRSLPTQALAITSSSPLMSMPNAADCTAPSSSLPSGNSTGVGGLNRGMAVARTALPGMGPLGVPNLTAGMSNALPSGLPGAGAINLSTASSPVSIARRSREVMAMGHVSSPTLNNVNSNLPSPVVSSPTQNHQQQQQLVQHNTPQPQQQSPSQQQAYTMMRAAKERQQLQQQQQKRIIQQQPSPTSNSLPSSQLPPASQPQHGISPNVQLFPQQHQPPHLLMQQHMLAQEPGSQQQHGVTSSSLLHSTLSPSGQPSQSGNPQQQPLLSQPHLSTSMALPAQPSFQVKQHHNLSIKQQPQQLGKNMKGRGVLQEGQSNMFPSQVCAQSTMEGTVPSSGQHLVSAPSVPNIPVNLSQVADVGVQQFQQKGFLQPLSAVKQMPQQQGATAIPSNPFIQPIAPSTAGSAPHPPSLAAPVGPLPLSQQQRRVGQPSHGQQRRPQQPQLGISQLVSPAGKNGMQVGPVPSQLPAGFQLGSSTNMGSPSSGTPLSSASNTGSGPFPSQWKPGQNFSPMTAGLYNLSRTNSGIAAQAPHLAMSVGMHLPSPGGRTLVSSNTLVTQDSRGGSHAGSVPQKASVDSGPISRAVTPASPHGSLSHRQLAQQQQPPCTPSSTGGSQGRPSSAAPAPE